MKLQAIEKIYTEKVAELLSAGWYINTRTMSGCQGEMARVDLTDGTEIRRVVMYRESFYGGCNGFTGNKLVVMVGRNTDKLRGYDPTIWNDHLEPLFKVEFAEVESSRTGTSDGWYVTLDKASAIQHIRNARWDARENRQKCECSEAQKQIALRWLKKQPRMKTCRLADIERMERTHSSDGRIAYNVKARNTRFIIR